MITFKPDSLIDEISKNNKSLKEDKDGAVIVNNDVLSITKTLNKFRFKLQFDNLNGGYKEIYYKGYILVYPIN